VDLSQMLGGLSKSAFVRDYFHRLPFSSTGGAAGLLSLGSWQSLAAVLGQPGLDLLVVRDGQQYAGLDPADPNAAQELTRRGYTLVVRHAEKHYAPISELARSFEHDFAADVNVHLYVTPAGGQGFSWHYDAEDVFIVQTAGSKEYSLRKNTVQPWPLEETLPVDMKYAREIMPLLRSKLTAGDWLYIPCGYWHKADAAHSTEEAISLAIGVMSPAAIDVFDFLRAHLLESLVWRQRLPVRGVASALSAEEQWHKHRELFRQLAADLSKALSDEELVRDFLDRRPDATVRSI
jgi:50S ribosomal protein L16 3-hydroxylase